MSFQRQQTQWLVLKLLLITTKIHAEVITCYFGTWAVYRSGDGKFQFEDIDPFKCTHIIYAFVGINSDGSIKSLDSYLDYDLNGFKRFNALKERNPDLKTLVALGGGSASSKLFSDVVSNPSSREKLKSSAIDLLTNNKFDGLDLDWEYPGQLGGAVSDKENFSKLIQELRDEFNKHNFLLTAAVSALPSSVDISFDVPTLSRNLDFIHVMAYDFHGTWDTSTGENSPLYGSSADVSELQKTLNVDAGIRGWLDRGADPQKIVLGMPVYGRSFTLSDPNQNGIGAPITRGGDPGPITQTIGSLGYNEICKYLQSGEWTTVWNDQQKVPLALKGNQWVGYDNPDSIKLKVNYAKETNLAGAMIWSIETDDFEGLCGDRYPILSAINQEYGRGKRLNKNVHRNNKLERKQTKHVKKHKHFY